QLLDDLARRLGRDQRPDPEVVGGVLEALLFQRRDIRHERAALGRAGGERDELARVRDLLRLEDQREIAVGAASDDLGEALTEVIAGRADCYFALVFQAKKIADAGKLIALATSSPKRSALMPNIATLEEQGFQNASYNFWV